MTMKTVMKFPMLALASVLLLAGCGNGPDQGSMLKSLRTSALSKLKGGSAAAPQQLDVAAALKATDASMALISQKDRGGTQALVVQIEQNGPYRTYATASRQTLTLRQGLVTNTRGLGDDIMSSEVSGSLSLIAARRAGTSTRVLHYLNGAKERVAVRYDCETYVTGSERVAQGVISANATELTENCVSSSHKFTNTYLVDGTGTILSSQQWISPMQGYYDIRLLRR